MYKLTTTNTKSGKIPPKKILPNVPRISTVIPQDNRQPDITINGEKYIWVEVVDGRDHYKKEGDTVEPITLYFSNGEEIYGPMPDLEPILKNVAGKRSPDGKRTQKRIRSKKNTRKAGNKKNKSKKRNSRVNKKRSGSKTRKITKGVK